MNASTMTPIPTTSDGVADAAGRGAVPDADDPVAELPTGGARNPVRRGRTRPVRLATWGSDGVLVEEPVPPAGAPDIRTWVQRGQSEHADRTFAVVYDDDVDVTPREPAAVAPWRDRLRSLRDSVRPASQPVAAGTLRWVGETTPTSLALLRRWVDEVLSAHVDLSEVGSDGASLDASVRAAVSDTVLLVDELASNVVEHAGGRLTVELTVAQRRVLVVVPDPRPGHPPAIGHPPAVQPSGRGLLIVDALSVRWGIVIGRLSKAVWAEVDWPT